MLKKELIEQVSTELSLPKQDVTTALEIMLTTMREALTEKRRIELRGFGSFFHPQPQGAKHQKPQNRRHHEYSGKKNRPLYHEQVIETAADQGVGN